MSALVIRPSRAARPALRVADPAYSVLRLVAGTLMFLGTTSTASIRSLDLAPTLRAVGSAA